LLPAAKWVARLVAGKQLTIAGAFFVGSFIGSAIISVLNVMAPKNGIRSSADDSRIDRNYYRRRLRRGLGRLACISFAAVYGVAVQKAHPLVRWIFDRWPSCFSTNEENLLRLWLGWQQVVPIQAITPFVFIALGLIATWLFLKSSSTMAFSLTMTVTQGWRWPWRLLPPVGYFVADNNVAATDLTAGLEMLWQADVLLALQTLWVFVFVMFGKNMVTNAQISFHLRGDRVRPTHKTALQGIHTELDGQRSLRSQRTHAGLRA
jgi:hypothetical protein